MLRQVAIANNIDVCVDLTNKLEKQIRLTIESQGGEISLNSPKTSTDSPLTGRSFGGSMGGVNRQELLEKIDLLKKRWGLVLEAAIFALLDEIFEDCRRHLGALMTRDWWVLASRSTLSDFLLG